MHTPSMLSVLFFSNALFLLTSQAGAQTINLSRAVDGINSSGETLQVSLSFEKNGGTGNVIAIGLQETLPPTMQFSGVLEGQPFISPENGATGVIEFAWVTIPTFPFTLVYEVLVVGTPAQLSEIVGFAEFRVGRDSEFSPTEITSIGNGSTQYVLTRTIQGSYGLDPELTVTVTIDSNLDTTLLGATLREQLPSGWSFLGVNSTGGAPDTDPPIGATGLLEFVWAGDIERPFVLSYRVNTGAETLPTVELAGELVYTSAGELEKTESLTSTIENEAMDMVKTMSGCSCSPIERSANSHGEVIVLACVLTAILLVRRRYMA